MRVVTRTMFFASNSILSLSAGQTRLAITPVFLLLTTVVHGAEPASLIRPHPEDIMGTLTCTSVSCHGGAESRQTQNEISGHAYVLWLGRGAKYRDGRKSYDPRAVLERTGGDPHALAAQ